MGRKSVFALLAVLVLLLGVVVTPAGAAGQIRVGVGYNAAGLGDNGFNDMVQEGALAAVDDLGVRLTQRELVGSGGQIRDAEQLLTQLGRRSDLVVAVSFMYGDAAVAAAAARPGTNFAVIDWNPGVAVPNLLGAETATNEGSFLVGAAAALASDSTHVGFIGGVDAPVIQQFEVGYIAGVEHIDPSMTVEVDFVGDFFDTAQMYDNAMAMYESGIDVIYHAAGPAGYALFDAAHDYTVATGEHVWAIGVDVDQYNFVDPTRQPHVLTSMVKNVDVVTYDIIESEVNGTFTGGYEVWDLSTGAVDYVTTGGFVDAYVPTLEALRQDIIDGVIVVPSV